MSASHGRHWSVRGWPARGIVACTLATLVFALVPASRLSAQIESRADGPHAPRFMLAMNGGRTEPMDASRVPVLRQRLTLDLEGVTLKQAITAISRQSGLVIWYSDDVLRRNTPVHLRADAITVAAALTDVLMDAGVDVVFSRDGTASLVKRTATAAPIQGGTIRGRVTDARTQEALPGIRVFILRANIGTTTDRAGRYRLTDVEPGMHHLGASQIGYKLNVQPVTVVEGREATIDIAMESVPTSLDEVVVTATGEQRLLELGHVVGRIKADSIVKAAPISTLSELLTSRVPGLMVFQNQGTVGGKVDLRIRGFNSLILGPEPIVVMDGVRYTTALRPMGAAATDRSAGDFGDIPGPARVEPTSSLNDINVNDIESIEVVKGPSAATLYGSDAANGVVVITTKRGRPGPARWNAYAKGTITEIATPHFPDIYWGWGDAFGVPDNTTTSCTIAWLGLGVCSRQDSVTVLRNPLNDPQLTIFGSNGGWQTGANVAGGQGDLRYYFSADVENATGPIQMPPAMVDQLKQARGLRDLPEEWREPNALAKLNLRSNITALLADATDLRLSIGYMQGTTRTLGLYQDSYGGALGTTPAASYGGGATAPTSSFLQTSTEDIKRFNSSATGQWRALPWLQARSTVGLDITSSSRHSLSRRGDAADIPNGAVGEDQGRQVETTAEFGAVASVRRGSASSRTAVGVQYVRDFTNSVFIYGSDLPPGGSSVQQALTLQSRQTHGGTVTAGGYVEETVGLNDRLFLTGALRLDGSSTFGRDYNTAAFPKASVSWLASEEPFMPRLPGLDELRLRYAFGASGRQPRPRWGLPQFNGSTTLIDGVVERTVVNTALGNPDLRPERATEHEFGFDTRALDRRLSLGLTWFRRRAQDQIMNFERPPGLGTAYLNIGLTKQRGFEAEVTAHVLDTRLLSLDLRLQHGKNTTDLVDLGGAPASRSLRGGFVEGYPLGARFGFSVIGSQDLNGDGLVDFSELVMTDTAVYLGESLPPESQTLTTVLALFDGRLRLSALAERRAGFTQINPFACVFPGSCRAGVDRTTPPAEQIQAQAALIEGGSVEKGDFIRLREASVAVNLPALALRALRVREATLALSARNLALWTSFSGPDPESAPLFFERELGAVTGQQASGVPMGRSYQLRIDLAF